MLEPASYLALSSTAPPVERPTIPKGDFGHPPPIAEDEGANAGADVAQQVEPLDVTTATVVERAENATTYRAQDGAQTTRLYTAPVNFQNAQGEWQPIDPTVVSDDAGGYRNAAGPTRFSFAGNTDAPEPVGVEGDGWSLRFGLEGAARGKTASAEGNQVTYQDVGGGTDLQYQLGLRSLKELIVLERPPAGEDAGRFRFSFTLEGVSAVDTEGGIDFVKGQSEVVARIPNGRMWDSRQSDQGRAEQPLDVALDTRDGTTSVEVVADQAWLASPERVYPVYVDPTVQLGSTHDAHVESSHPNSNYGADGEASIGDTGTATYRAFMRFDDVELLAGRAIMSAYWNGYFSYSWSPLSRTDYFIKPADGPWDESTVTWNTQPGVLDELIQDQAKQDEWRRVDLTSWVRNWVDGSWPNDGIELDADDAGSTSYKEVETSESTNPLQVPFLEVTHEGGPISTNHPPPEPTSVAPAPDATVFNQTPKLQVSPVIDADGDTVQYWFRVATGFEGEAPGQVVDSGWIGTTNWTVPKYTLEDGVSYVWTAYTWDGEQQTKASWWNPFIVDLRLGAASSPTDSLGPVTVDLATGNGSVALSSPSYPTVGGSIGVSYGYNTLASVVRGLRGEYFEDANANRLFDDTKAQTSRLDTQVSFEWQSDTPYPFIPSDNFLARWTGFVTVPNGGSWSFGAASDDGVRIWVNNTLVLDRWFGQSFGAPNYGSSVSLSAGQTVPIKVEYYEATGDAALSLKVRGPGVANDTTIPASWLTPPSNGSLPSGWVLDTGAGDVSYVSARVNDLSVTLLGPLGDTHEYTRSGTGFTPPPGEDGVLAADASTGNLVLHDSDGVVYTFTSDGRLDSAKSSTDDANQASPMFVWSGTPTRVTAVRDPVAGREMVLAYGDGDCPAPPGGGFDASPPAGMLCRVVYWDGNQTHLFYASGQLARVQDPGGEITDFGYASGRLFQVRDSLAADAVAAGKRVNDATVVTSLLYDSADRVRFVELPGRTAGAARASHTYA